MAVISIAGLFAQDSSFETVSVRLGTKASRESPPALRMLGGPGTQEPLDVTMTSFPLLTVILDAYRIPTHRLVGPSWLAATWLDIHATMPVGTTKAQYAAALRTLLAERFHLMAHREMREADLYEMTVDPQGHRMRENLTNPPEPPGNPFDDGIPGDGPDGLPLLPPGRTASIATRGRARLQAVNMPMSALAVRLESILRIPFRDATGLSGKYDFVLEFDPGLPLPARVPASFPRFAAPPIAVQQQLGLHLERKRGPVEIVVIDSVDPRPTEN